MPRRLVSDEGLAEIVRRGGATWRYSALEVAVQLAFGCSERTARRRIREAVRAGVLCRAGPCYVATPTGSAPKCGPAPERETQPANAIEARVGSLPRAQVDRLQFLRRLEHTYTASSLTEFVTQISGCSNRTARRTIRCAQLFGYIERCDDGYRRTAEATIQLEAWGQLHGVKGERFARFCSGRPLRFGTEGLPTRRLSAGEGPASLTRTPAAAVAHALELNQRVGRPATH